MPDSPATDRLSRLETLALWLCWLIVPLFGVLVVYRSAYANVRHTDFAAYARAGWAVRSGADIYEVQDERGLHFCYPPTFALLMTPFAEPPTPDSRIYLPFAWSISIWYVINVVLLFAATHMLASAVDTYSKRGSRRWWAMRVWPILFTLPAIGNSLSHSQSNIVLLFLLAASISSALSNRSIRAGLWLAAATALKVIPAFLLLVPLLRRDRKWFLGYGVGLVVYLFILPALAFGPQGALEVNKKFIDVMVRPAVAGAADAERAVEMFHVLRTDNQSLQAVFHAWMFWGNPNAPAEPGAATRLCHWMIGAGLTLITIVAGWSRQIRAGSVSDESLRLRFRLGLGHANDQLLLFACLITVMLFVSPMCHLHYYVLTLPLLIGLLATWWRDAERMWPGNVPVALLTLHVVGGAIPLIWEPIRNFGFAPLTTVPLWCAAIRILRRGRTGEEVVTVPQRRVA